MEVAGSQMILGLLIGIITLVVLILKTKVHVFLALIISSALTGLIGGMPANTVVDTIIQGFGSTLGSIGIIIGFGVMMGQIFEISGAAEKMAQIFLKKFGKDKEEYALATTGFLVSIPIFCDSGFVILSPLARALSRKTGKSMVTLGASLAAGLVITHSLVPPTPGPLAVAGIFGANIGSLIFWSIILAIPMTIASIAYAKYIGKKIYQVPEKDGDGWTREAYELDEEEEMVLERELPSAFMSFLPILLPIVLILLGNVTTALKLEGPVKGVIDFLGAPIIAVGIGLLVSIIGLTKDLSREETLAQMEEGIKSAGVILLVTGGGGALGTILRESGVGTYIAEFIAKTPLPAILLPFVISSIIRLIQGSGTVAMITAASITAPIVSSLGVNPVLATLAACVGSLVFSHFNDSFFWVVNRLMGITNANEQMKIWSATSTVAWLVGLVCILILNIFL